MKQLLQKIVETIGPKLKAVAVPAAGKKGMTKGILSAFIPIRGILEGQFGPPAKFRFSGYDDECDPSSSCRDNPYRVIEFLWDFSYSRYAIPPAIEQRKRKAKADEKIGEGKFRLLFVVESELGTSTEACRDLLKLLESRAPLRCLIYAIDKGASYHSRLQARMLRVMSHHDLFKQSKRGWLFIGLDWTAGSLRSEFFTLNRAANGFVRLSWDEHGAEAPGTGHAAAIN